MAGDKTATFTIPIKADAASAKTAADALEQLRARIEGGQQAIRGMVGDLKRLKGSTDEVRKVKQDLRARIDAEQKAISTSNLAILKQGKSYDALAAAHKRAKPDPGGLEAYNRRAEALSDVLGKTAGPLGDVAGKIAGLGETAMGADGALAALTGGVGLLLAAVVAVTGALFTGAVALAKWIVEGANAARSAGLVREAFAGSAQQADAMGSQIAALARKVPTARAELQDLAISLRESKLGGKTYVDTLNAIAQANAALGTSMGTKLRSIIERGISPLGREMRLALSPQELVGSGLNFDDVAAALAKSMGKGVAEARAALMSGRVPLAAGAAAIRAAVEGRVAGINLRKMLDLNTISLKFHESLSQLTRDVNLEPMLRGFQKIASLFDESTVSGKALHDLVTRLGDSIAKGFAEAVPLIEQFVKGLILGALKLEGAYLRVRVALHEAFAQNETLKSIEKWWEGTDKLRIAAGLGVGAVTGLAMAFGLLALNITLAVALLTAPLVLAASPFIGLYVGAKAAYEKLKTLDWKQIGEDVIRGLLGPLGQTDKIVESIMKLGTAIKDAFKKALKISSPSKVFEGYGEMTGLGYVQGLERVKPLTTRATGEIVAGRALPEPGGHRSGASAGGGVTNRIEVNFVVTSEQAARELRHDTSFLADLTKAIEEACVGAGVPIMQETT